MKISYRTAFAGFACALLLVAPCAEAALLLNLNGGAVIVPDNAAGDADPAIGRIVNTSVIAGFGVSISISQSNSPGTATAGLLEISSLQIQNGNAGIAALSINVSDTGFTSPGGAGDSMLLDSDFGGTFAVTSAVGDNVSFRSFADPANSQPAGPVATAPLLFMKNFSIDSESFSGSNNTLWIRGGGPYSLANQINISLSPGGQVNLSGTTTSTAMDPNVPEPGTLMALGAFAVPTLAFRRRR